MWKNQKSLVNLRLRELNSSNKKRSCLSVEESKTKLMKYCYNLSDCYKPSLSKSFGYLKSMEIFGLSYDLSNDKN